VTWSRLRLDAVASEVRETVDPQELGETEVEHYSIPALDAMGLPDVVPASEIMSGKQRLRGGEVLVSRLNPRKARVLTVPTLGDRPALSSGEFIVLRPFGIEPRFLNYLLLAESTRQFLDARVQSVTRSHQRVRPEHLTKMWINVPDPVEQRAIADYLDAETARIDALIEKKRRLTELVSERMDAEVRNATRRGIAHVPARQSSVPWIGEIPVTWQELPMKRIGRLLAGVAFPDAEQGFEDGPIPWFKVVDFGTPGNEEYLSYAANTVTSATAQRLHAQVAPGDTVVFPKIGAALLSNRRRMLSQPSCMDQNVMGLVVTDGMARYFYYLLQSFDFGRLRMPGPVPLLNERDASDLIIPVPPLDVQHEVVEYLDALLPTLRQVVDRESDLMALLLERRTCLITASVTGELGAAA
jgi:type I restriction enzyme, S subunit